MAAKKAADSSSRGQLPEPIDVVDGIPDRSSNPAVWKYLLIFLIFAAWVAFLVYCGIAGRPSQ